MMRKKCEGYCRLQRHPNTYSLIHSFYTVIEDTWPPNCVLKGESKSRTFLTVEKFLFSLLRALISFQCVCTQIMCFFPGWRWWLIVFFWQFQHILVDKWDNKHMESHIWMDAFPRFNIVRSLFAQHPSAIWRQIDSSSFAGMLSGEKFVSNEASTVSVRSIDANELVLIYTQCNDTNNLHLLQACMILSSMYHTFSCRSEKDYWCFLSFDLFGIALSLLAIYMSGVYYAFWCHKVNTWHDCLSVIVLILHFDVMTGFLWTNPQELQQFYLITVLLIFVVAMALQIPKFNVNGNIKLAVFVGWAAYGVLPTLHWSIAMGGMENPMVALLLPRVLGMYVISGTAFLIYMTRIPERFYPGL